MFIEALAGSRWLRGSRGRRSWFGIHSPSLARVVEVEHRGDGVHAQAVDVILLEPEQGAREQEAADFVASVVEDERSPVLVLALPRVGVLVEVRAVEVGQAVRVLRKMGRHPVEDDTEPGLVQADRRSSVKSSRRAVAAGRREVADGLIAPGAVERMLGDRQELDMRVSPSL